MNDELINLLKQNMGLPMSSGMAADICVIANQIPTLIPFDVIDKIHPETHGEFTFSLERIEGIADEIKPLHRAHWLETEAHRHGLPFNPDYETFFRYERAGRYVLFTLRSEGNLSGNCAMYLYNNAHTQTITATEDTLYLLPEARKGRVASRFVAYCEKSLRRLGTREINITVKTVNKAARFFRMLGYRHVENGLIKILEAENV